MNFLDIIIPHYKESEEVVSHLLDSIARQKKVNFSEIGVIIINDASKMPLSDAFINKYKTLQIKHIINDVNKGQGQTEQDGVNISKAKYVTFIDSDDELFDNDSLSKVISLLKQTTPNILCTSMVQENMKEGKLIPSVVTFNNLRTLHGIFVKRKYLIEHNVKFATNLRYFEDTYYVSILTCRNDYKIAPIITYVWKYNDQSKTLEKNKYSVSVRYFMDMYNSFKGIYEYFCSESIKNREIYIFQQIIELKLALKSSDFDFPELESDKNNYNQLVNKLYNDNIDAINSINPLTKRKIFDYQLRDFKSYYKNVTVNLTYEEFEEDIKK